MYITGYRLEFVIPKTVLFSSRGIRIRLADKSFECRDSS